MLHFESVFVGAKIVQALSAQSGWRDFRGMICLGDPVKYDFYVKSRSASTTDDR